MVFPVRKGVMLRHLVMGGDREAMLSLLLIVVVLVYGIGGVWLKLLFVTLGAAGAFGLRILARTDPWYVPVMIRSRSLYGRYPARGCLEELIPGR